MGRNPDVYEELAAAEAAVCRLCCRCAEDLRVLSEDAAQMRGVLFALTEIEWEPAAADAPGADAPGADARSAEERRAGGELARRLARELLRQMRLVRTAPGEEEEASDLAAAILRLRAAVLRVREALARAGSMDPFVSASYRGGVSEVARWMGVSRKRLGELRAAGAPFPGGLSRPDMVWAWLEANPEPPVRPHRKKKPVVEKKKGDGEKK